MLFGCKFSITCKDLCVYYQEMCYWSQRPIFNAWNFNFRWTGECNYCFSHKALRHNYESHGTSARNQQTHKNSFYIRHRIRRSIFWHIYWGLREILDSRLQLQQFLHNKTTKTVKASNWGWKVCNIKKGNIVHNSCFEQISFQNLGSSLHYCCWTFLSFQLFVSESFLLIITKLFIQENVVLETLVRHIFNKKCL